MRTYLCLFGLIALCGAQAPLPKVFVTGLGAREDVQRLQDAARGRFEVVWGEKLDRKKLDQLDDNVRCVVVSARSVSDGADRIEKFVEGGGGCVVIGGTLNRVAPAARGLLGLRERVDRMPMELGEVRAVWADHPAAGPFRSKPWTGFYSYSGREAIADGQPILVDGSNVVAWARKPDKGRVVVTGCGGNNEHDAVALAHHVEAIAWAGRIERPKRPKGATVLFDGSTTEHWMAEKGGGPCAWRVVEGTLEATKGKGSIMTREAYGDFRMHVEFMVPKGQGNSGVYLQRRYEVQILNTAGLAPKPHFCGSLYRYRAPDLNAAFPAGAWQTFDITFKQPRWEGVKKTAHARITVRHNGITVHDDAELTRKTGAGKPEGPEPRPILLQDHGWPIRFRNVWIQKL